jgi:hypothetical protein
VDELAVLHLGRLAVEAVHHDAVVVEGLSALQRRGVPDGMTGEWILDIFHISYQFMKRSGYKVSYIALTSRRSSPCH